MPALLNSELESRLKSRLSTFKALDACHARVIEHLHKLDEMVSLLEADGGVQPGTRQLAAECMQFFCSAARAHHEEEERSVFPALLASSDTQLVQNVQRLQQDHGWLEEDWHELSLQVSAVAEGYSWYDLDALRPAVQVFTALYQDHIELEESLIYPAARQAIEGEFENIGRRLAANRREAMH